MAARCARAAPAVPVIGFLNSFPKSHTKASVYKLIHRLEDAQGSA
jgi:hypothetical protein